MSGYLNGHAVLPAEESGQLRFLGSINATAQGEIAHHSGANSTGFGCFSQFSPSRGSSIVIPTNGTQGSELWARVIAAIGDL